MKFHPPNKTFTSAYRCFLFRITGSMILLITTRGRRSGKPHTIGLQYELIHGKYWVGAADGTRADWYRNILAQPKVEIQVGAKKIHATAETISDPERIADFLVYRLKKRPLILRLILRLDGLKGQITREKLLGYATCTKVVTLTPEQPQ